MDFWEKRHKLNSEVALINQWKMYEEVGTIDNFRITAGLKEGKRRGFFYTDSDLHKWADATAGALKKYPLSELSALLDEYIELMRAAQDDDGYLYTFNQINFPGCRWKNLQIEHELYTMGHFIEAGISCGGSPQTDNLLPLAIRSADLIVREFSSPRPNRTPGHQEIELALIHLSRLTGNEKYLQCAQGFLDQRGKMLSPGFQLIRELRSHNKRMKTVGSNSPGFEYGENIMEEEPPFINLRFAFGALSGTYLQQHRPLKKQIEPKGHSVRWTYMQTAAAMAASDNDARDIRVLEKTWNSLVNTKMHVTGGIGPFPSWRASANPTSSKTGPPTVRLVRPSVPYSGIMK